MASNKKAKAIYDYKAEHPSSLSFSAGDIIDVISEMSPSGPDWWEGQLYGQRGSFPLNHVEILKPNKKGQFDLASTAPSGNAPAVVEPKIGKPKRPELFQHDHIAWKVAFVLSAIAMVAMLIALIMPWYFIKTPQIPTKEFQPFGLKKFNEGTLGNPRAVITSTTGDYQVYDAKTEPETKRLHLICFALVITAYFIQFLLTLLLFARIRGYIVTVFYFPVLSLASFLMVMISPAFYAKNINAVIKKEIIAVNGQDRFSQTGPVEDFTGKRQLTQTIVNGTVFGAKGEQEWGPTAAFVFAVIAIFPAFACYFTLFLVVLGRRILCCGRRLKGGE